MKKDFLVTTILENLYLVFNTLVVIFGVIFFYEIFDENIFLTLLPFGVSHFIYALLVKNVSKFIGQMGIRLSLLLSIFLFSLSAGITYLFEQSGSLILIYMWFAMYYLAKLFYHPPIIYLLGKNSNHEKRATLFGFRHMTFIVGSTLIPILGGLLSDKYGLLGITIVASCIITLGIIPIMFLPNIKYKVDLNVKSWLRKKRVRKSWLINLVIQAQDGGSKIWPIYMFIIFSGSFIKVGTLIGITAGISMLSLLFLGKYLSNHNRFKTLKTLMQTNSISWMFRALASTPTLVMLSDAFGSFSQRLMNHSRVTVDYDLMNHNISPEQRDEYIIMREIGIDTATGIGLILIGVLSQLYGFQVAFIVSALIGTLFLFLH